MLINKIRNGFQFDNNSSITYEICSELLCQFPVFIYHPKCFLTHIRNIT